MKIPMEELKKMSLFDLANQARRLGIVGSSLMSKEELVRKIDHVQEHPDEELEVDGVLEKLPDGFGFLRSAKYDYVSGPEDIYVSPSQIRRFNLRTGDIVTGAKNILHY
jgi:transcription termination factor Rho